MGYDAHFWDRFFEHYDGLNEVLPYVDLLDRVVELTGARSGQLVLDAGAGTGNAVGRLRARGADVIALDANARGLVRALRKEPGLTCLLASLEEDLPIADGICDALVSVNVLFSLSPQGRGRAIREFRRVLRPGGKLVVATPVEKPNPFLIYGDTIRRWIGREGLRDGLVRTARFVPKAAAILYYAARIARGGTQGNYRFHARTDLCQCLEEGGFLLEGVERTYANQAWVAWASAPS